MKTKKIDSGTNSDIGILVDDLLPRWSGAGGGGEATAREGAPACGLRRVSPPSSTSASAERRCVASVELMRVVELLLVVELEVLHVLVPSVELWCVIVDGGGAGTSEQELIAAVWQDRRRSYCSWLRCSLRRSRKKTTSSTELRSDGGEGTVGGLRHARARRLRRAPVHRCERRWCTGAGLKELIAAAQVDLGRS